MKFSFDHSALKEPSKKKIDFRFQPFWFWYQMIQRTTTSKRSITLPYTLHNLFDTVSFLLGKQTRILKLKSQS